MISRRLWTTCPQLPHGGAVRKIGDDQYVPEFDRNVCRSARNGEGESFTTRNVPSGPRPARSKFGDMDIIMAKKRKAKRRPTSNGSDNDPNPMKVALLCASAGVPVVPLHGVKDGECTCGDADCEQRGKHPRTKTPTTNRALIKQHWTKWPKARIGLALGTKSGVIALVTEGPAGTKTLRDLEEKKE